MLVEVWKGLVLFMVPIEFFPGDRLPLLKMLPATVVLPDKVPPDSMVVSPVTDPFKFSVPASIKVLPKYVLTPFRFTIPVPDIITPGPLEAPAPAIGLRMLNVLLISKVKP